MYIELMKVKIMGGIGKYKIKVISIFVVLSVTIPVYVMEYKKIYQNPCERGVLSVKGMFLD